MAEIIYVRMRHSAGQPGGGKYMASTGNNKNDSDWTVMRAWPQLVVKGTVRAGAHVSVGLAGDSRHALHVGAPLSFARGPRRRVRGQQNSC